MRQLHYLAHEVARSLWPASVAESREKNANVGVVVLLGTGLSEEEKTRFDVIMPADMIGAGDHVLFPPSHAIEQTYGRSWVANNAVPTHVQFLQTTQSYDALVAASSYSHSTNDETGPLMVCIVCLFLFNNPSSTCLLTYPIYFYRLFHLFRDAEKSAFDSNDAEWLFVLDEGLFLLEEHALALLARVEAAYAAAESFDPLKDRAVFSLATVEDSGAPWYVYTDLSLSNTFAIITTHHF